MATTQTSSSSSSRKSKKASAPKTITRAVQGTFCWFELHTPNVDAAAAFYADVVGWERQSMPMGADTLTVFGAGKEVVAHAETHAGPAEFLSHVTVDDVDVAAKRVTAAGGRVLVEPFDVPTIGRMAQVQDPDGARFFLYRSEGDSKPQPRIPGGVIWNELLSRDVKKAVAFFTSVFGYSVSEMPMPGFSYHVLSKGKDQLAGVMPQQQPGAPSSFVPYIQVKDVDAARARALKRGAQALGDIMAVDNVGRFAVMLDPQGACFAVMTPAS